MNGERHGKNPLEQEDLLVHCDALLRFALPRVGDLATAEDLVQETLLTAVTRWETFSRDSSLRTWLIGILRHKILDHYRAVQRRGGDSRASYEKDGADGDPWFTPMGAWRENPNLGLEVLDADPSKAVERARLRDALRFCIARLPDGLRQVFVLRELEGLDPDETCEAVGIARSSVAVFLYRARQALRACIQRQGVRNE